MPNRLDTSSEVRLGNNWIISEFRKSRDPVTQYARDIPTSHAAVLAAKALPLDRAGTARLLSRGCPGSSRIGLRLTTPWLPASIEREDRADADRLALFDRDRVHGPFDGTRKVEDGLVRLNLGDPLPGPHLVSGPNQPGHDRHGLVGRTGPVGLDGEEISWLGAGTSQVISRSSISAAHSSSRSIDGRTFS